MNHGDLPSVIAAADGSTAPPCLVVGIGASAGGQAAIEQLLATIPTDCGVSFVVVVHLPPDGPTLLADLFNRYTSMEVVTAEDGMPLKPDRVQVIPPGNDLIVESGLIRLQAREDRQGPHHPIDLFFQSLAREFKGRSIALLLSGFGTDGTEGVRAIRGVGGTVIVQKPDSALNPSMPQSAISAAGADFVLAAEDMAEKISEIARGNCQLSSTACQTTTHEEDLADIFRIVKEKTGHDFSSYKINTVVRRIERRMALHDAGGFRKYITLLESAPQEAQALCQEILIGVTSFFRDAAAFEVFRSEVIPRLFAGHDSEVPVRIWHACCSTGEEVYSTAILIQEYLKERKMDARVQFFATDIDDVAIAQARAGLYDDDCVAELGEERLNEFFTRYGNRWQVNKSLRESIVFAHHSLIKDPPFSRLDLLVCRNFLIYLNADMQKRLISLFHMVLKPGGVLFLGASESIGRNSGLFNPLDKKWKFFERLEGGKREETLFPFPVQVRKFSKIELPQRTAATGEPSPVLAVEQLLLERYSPPCVIVNDKYEVIHVSSRAGRFLEIPLGGPSRDILRMAREELRPSLRAAIYKAFTEMKQVNFRGVKVDNGSGGVNEINVLVEPLKRCNWPEKLAMVILEPAPPAQQRPAPGADEVLPGDEVSKDMLIRQLEEQLRVTHEQLQAVTEQLESSHDGFMSANEELMSINEEFQSTNEELQSTNEELETSKEELQALNEELATVNAELQGKVEELNQSNSDMENLLVSSEATIIFLDRNLAIKRFSPAMAAIFNLIPADIGRPFRHLAGTIDWTGLQEDAENVLKKLVPVEREVTAKGDGRCFLMRVLPYRTIEGVVDGIVVTLVDISEHKQLEEQTLHLASFPRLNPNPVLEVGLDGKITFSNPACMDVLERIGAETGSVTAFIPADLDELVRTWDRTSDAIYYREISIKEKFFGETIFLSPQLEMVRIYAYDISERKQMEDALRQAKEEWERTFDSVPDLIAIMDREHRIVRVNRAMAKRLELQAEECVGRACFHCVHSADGPPEFCPHIMTLADGREHVVEVREESLGGDFLITTTPLMDDKGEIAGTVHIARDITERKKAEDTIKRHVAELSATNKELEQFNRASVGRELRMIELKKEVNELCRRAGEAQRYPLEFEEE